MAERPPYRPPQAPSTSNMVSVSFMIGNVHYSGAAQLQPLNPTPNVVPTRAVTASATLLIGNNVYTGAAQLHPLNPNPRGAPPPIVSYNHGQPQMLHAPRPPPQVGQPPVPQAPPGQDIVPARVVSIGTYIPGPGGPGGGGFTSNVADHPANPGD